jgi:penicillin G amidase
MATIFRWLMRLVIGSALLAVAAAVVLYWFFARSVPDYTARWTSDAVSAPVEIVRDNANVPHIHGATDEDVFFGLGFAHAQDRLWQMTMLRRAVQGRLSELFGARTLRIDELMRRLDLYPLAVSSVAAQDAPTTAALEAYARGVNAWLGIVNDEALGRGAPEFWVFPPEIAPWTPADSLAIAKLMALRLSDQLEDEVLRAQVSLVLPPERLRDILPDAPGEAVIDLPEYAALFPHLPPTAWAGLGPAAKAPRDPLDPAPPRGFGGASNAWAAAPSRSAAGGTLLANDPHLGFSAPSIWYLAALHLSTGGVIGGTIPGMPAVLVGRSERLGWGLTSSYVDDQDLFIERLNPDNPGEVLTPDGWRPLRTRTSIITVRDAQPVTVTLQWSENGPILPGHHFNLASITPPGHAVSLGWTALDPADTSASAALALMRAGSVDEAIAAGEGWIAPAQNWILADRSRIAHQMVGAMPRRSVRHQSQGRIPAPGWLPENRWQGRMEYTANPAVLDPEGGILGNTNNKISDAPFPFHVSYRWGDTQRIERWRRLMQARQVHTRDSFVEAQLDTVSFPARSLLPLIGANLWYTGEPAPEGTPERRRQRALQLLAEWNGEMNEHLPEPLLYAAWVRALQDRLVRDDLGPLARAFTQVEPVFLERVFRDVDGASAWCDVIQTDRLETCEEMARLALDDALLWIAERYGPSLESLRWGDAHQATHDHEVLGEVPGLGLIVNIRQSTSGGDNTLMRGQLKGTGPDPFLNTHGAGYRGVYDFADPDSSVFIIATGQSGHPLSRHYDDLGERWRRGEYIPMSLDPDLARAAAVGITVIEPAE